MVKYLKNAARIHSRDILSPFSNKILRILQEKLPLQNPGSLLESNLIQIIFYQLKMSTVMRLNMYLSQHLNDIDHGRMQNFVKSGVDVKIQ